MVSFPGFHFFSLSYLAGGKPLGEIHTSSLSYLAGGKPLGGIVDQEALQEVAAGFGDWG